MMCTFHKYKKKGSTKDFWEYRIYYQDPITRKTREKSKKGFTNKAEAKLAAEEMERQLREGHNPTDESLKSYLETWLNEYKKGSPFEKGKYRQEDGHYPEDFEGYKK